MRLRCGIRLLSVGTLEGWKGCTRIGRGGGRRGRGVCGSR